MHPRLRLALAAAWALAAAPAVAADTVPLVDKVADKRGTRAVAQASLDYLYSPEGQEIIARHHLRPRDPAVAGKHEGRFPKLSLFTIDELFGGWKKAQRTHFDDGGVFDQIYGASK